MITSFILLTIRNIRKQPFFSFINISGLAVGLAACWLIGVYIIHERSYDQYLPKADRICAVAIDLKFGDEEGRTTNTPPPLAGHLVADFPEIEMTTRVFNLIETVVRRDKPDQTSVSFNETRLMAVDSSFLTLFEFPMTAGDFSALNQPGNIVLTEKTAKKYFGDNEAIGQILKINDREYKVTGMVKDLPAASSIQFNMLLPMSDFKVVERFAWSWIWLQVDTWARLRQVPTPENIAALEAAFPKMVNTYAARRPLRH
jgi:putative ABC transport system permease protein